MVLGARNKLRLLKLSTAKRSVRRDRRVFDLLWSEAVVRGSRARTALINDRGDGTVGRSGFTAHTRSRRFFNCRSSDFTKRRVPLPGECVASMPAHPHTRAHKYSVFQPKRAKPTSTSRSVGRRGRFRSRLLTNPLGPVDGHGAHETGCVLQAGYRVLRGFSGAEPRRARCNTHR